MSHESSSARRITGFSNVDGGTIDPSWHVDYLKRVNETIGIRRYKEKILELLDPQPGEHILDVGCGIGEGLRSVHEYTPTAKTLIGIDNSQTMITQAATLTPQDLLIGKTIMFKQDDAHSLSFEGERFDASYSDRTFQHLANPDLAFSEILRVTKSGGRVIIADTDWDTLHLKGVSPEAEEKIRSAYFNIIVNPRMGGMLQQLFIKNSLKDVEVVKESIELLDLQAIEDVLALKKSLNLARENGLLSEKEVGRCLKEVQEAQGVVNAALDIFIVKGIKLG